MTFICFLPSKCSSNVKSQRCIAEEKRKANFFGCGARLMWHDMLQIASMNFKFLKFPRQRNLSFSLSSSCCWKVASCEEKCSINYHWVIFFAPPSFLLNLLSLQIEIIKNVGQKSVENMESTWQHARQVIQTWTLRERLQQIL